MGDVTGTTQIAPEPDVTRERIPAARSLTSTDLRSADDVIYANEISRARVWVALCGALAASGLVAAVVTDEAPTEPRWLLAAGCVTLAIAVAIAQWVVRDERRYSRPLAQLFGYVCVACMLPAYVFLGWASAGTLLVPIGGIFFSMGHERRAVIAMAIATCGSHAAFALAVIFGVIADRGRTTLPLASHGEQLLLLVFVEGVCVSSFAIGRLLRAHTLDAVWRYGEAIREGARREALLQEALQDLDVARRGGAAGRYTGLSVGGFQLEAVIGRGAMGEVYEAIPVGDGEVVAVKVMTADGGRSPRAAERFEREIRAATALQSPHIVRVLAHSGPDDPLKYLAMERLRGESLADLVRGRALPVLEAIEMLDQVARAVDVAHAAGIIHRDLKPSNVFRHAPGSARPSWKVLDFGVSKMIETHGTLTAGAVIGTPAYMAPEQAAGDRVDPRADLFSLGAVAYRVLVGRPAFTGRDVASILYAVVHTMPPWPSAVAPVTADLDLALAIALAKQPDHRFASASELAYAIAAACRAELPDELRRRGEALVALEPWGRDVRSPRE